MPYVQPLPWTEFLTCPICTHSFGFYRRHPISLGCGHSVCRLCLASLYNQQCPFDQSPITVDHKNLPVNSALLRLASLRNGENCELSEILCLIPPPCVRDFTADNLRCFYVAKACIEHLAMHLHDAIANADNPLSRSMQRKMVTLINCQLMTEEGRLRAMRVSRCIGERAVIEMIMRQQKPMQLNSCLWAAVRGRGCQFLGPVLQEDVLRHLLSALAGGVALSRKSLVMQVVQSLKSEYSQASKTSVGHVVQLLYRASCFNVSKRECESSLMQLKHEFSTYDSLRQEHDAQIVQIAMEAGLRIPPEQWSTLLYGDLVHKSYMQSIIDRLQTPESFKQSIQELVLTLQRNGDMYEFENMRPHLQDLANIEISAEKPASTTWPELGRALHAIRNVVDGFVNFELRVRKQAEERRLIQRNCNGNGGLFSHAKSDKDSYRSENFRNMSDGEQTLRLSRPMMRPGMSTPTFPGPTNCQHNNPNSFRHGANIGLPMSVQQRYEAPQQTQSAPTYKLLHRPNQLQTAKHQNKTLLRQTTSTAATANSSPQSLDSNKAVGGAGGGVGGVVGATVPPPPPPGFESLRLSPHNGSNLTRSPCSPSFYSSSNSSDSNTTTCSCNKSQGRLTLLQSPWAQRLSDYEQHALHKFQHSQMHLSKWEQREQRQQQQQQQQQHQQQQYESTAMGAESAMYHSGFDYFDAEARDQKHIQELQQRFNQILRNTATKTHEKYANSDSGVNSPSQSKVSMGQQNELKAIQEQQQQQQQQQSQSQLQLKQEQQQQQQAQKKFEQSQQTQQALPFTSWHSSPKKSNSFYFSNFDCQNSADYASATMASNEFSNSDQVYKLGRHFDAEQQQKQQQQQRQHHHQEPKRESPKKDVGGGSITNFVMEFPKSSQRLQLKVPNISTERLREIWQVPIDQPEAKTIEEIWKPTQTDNLQQQHQKKQQHQQPEKSNEVKNLEDIWFRQRQQQQQQQQQQQLQLSQQSQLQQSHASELQSSVTNATTFQQSNSSCCCTPERSVESPTYADWLTRRNYACMEAAYMKIAERYPNMGLGPWTESSGFGGTGNASYTGNNSGYGTGTGLNGGFGGGMRPYSRAPEPSNLGLSALRLIGSLHQCNPIGVDAAGGGASPSPLHKTALDSAIETYWKDAMEASLGINMFLPPARNDEQMTSATTATAAAAAAAAGTTGAVTTPKTTTTTTSGYPSSLDNDIPQAVRSLWGCREELKPTETTTVAAVSTATPQPPQ